MLAIRCVYRSFQACKPHTRYYSSILRTPPPSTSQAPTPLVFVSAQAWSADSYHGMSAVASALAQKGYSCLETDISLPQGQIFADSPKLMQYFESELKNAIRAAEIAFPPVLVARSSACLIAQTYVSSHPASGLFLISPPASNACVSKTQLPTDLTEFNFEPKFPIAIMAALEEAETLRLHSRLGKDPRVDKFYVPNVDKQHLGADIEKWLDELGM